MTVYFLIAIKILAIIYFLLCIWFWFGQKKILYKPHRQINAVPTDIGIQYESKLIHTQDGEAISCWFVKGKEENKKGYTVLFCHGNASNLGDRLELIELYHTAGYDLLIFDYRGYGTSTGTPCEQGTYYDALSAWNYLRSDRNVSSDRIIIHGRSLGCAIATWLASQVGSGLLILEAGFTSIPDMAAIKYPYLPLFLCRYKYESKKIISNVSAPVIIAHSKEDKLIPFEQAQELFKKANEPKRFIELYKGHNDCWFETNEEKSKELFKCIEELLQV